jgi:hypothetical protein
MLRAIFFSMLVSWGQNRGKHCYSSGVTDCVSSVARVDSRTQRTKRGCNGLSWFGLSGPNIQQQMILVFKSTQNMGVIIECKREIWIAWC